MALADDRLLEEFCTPPRQAGLKSAPMGFDLRVMAFEGAQLRLAVGQLGGPRVLVLHGWGSGGGHMLGLARAIARAGCKPVVIDLPAHGASGGQTTTMLQCGRLLNQLLEEMRPIGICAHSFGAMASAMLCGGHAYFGGRRRADIKLFLVSPGYSLAWMVERHCRQQALPPGSAAQLRAALESQFDIDVEAFHLRQAARQLPPATQVFHDRDDPIIPFAQIAQILAEPGICDFHATRGNGHDRILLDRSVLRAAGAFFAPDAVINKK